MSQDETQLRTLKRREECHVTFWHSVFSKTLRIIIGLNDNIPYALQMGLEEVLGKQRKSPSVPWGKVVESLGHG